MAKKVKDQAETGSDKQYIGFKLGDEEFTAPLLYIQEIVEIPKVTYVPHVPDYVEGAINLRGRIVPVVDLKKRLDLGEKILSIDSRIIVFHIKNRTVGFIVDAITKIYELRNDQIELPSDMLLARSGGKFISGVCKLTDNLLLLLDIAKILELSKSEYARKKEKQKVDQ